MTQTAKPVDWNVIVLGAWNPAILTPEGIARRLFQLAPETPINVEIGFDRPGLLRVEYSGIVVTPSTKSLLLTPRSSTDAELARSASIAARALEALPETPVSAVGVNIRYEFTEIPSALTELLDSPLDDKLSDAEMRVAERMTKRAVTWKDGILNVELYQHEAAGRTHFNFHLGSSDNGSLREWLEKTDMMISTVKTILVDVIGVDLAPEEVGDV